MSARTPSEVREEAALLVAQAELKVSEIAERVGVTERTLFNWRKEPEFAAMVQRHRDDIYAAIRDRSIAHVEYRIGELQDMYDRAKRLVYARQNDPSMTEIPGGGTGLLVRQIKQVGAGANARQVEEYAADVGLMREIRGIMEQAAKELGQWSEKHEVDADVKTDSADPTALAIAALHLALKSEKQ